jgi:hypothetical protein
MLSNNGYGVKDKLLLVMTHDEIEHYLDDKDLNTFEYQLAMDAMLFAEQKTIERAREWVKNAFTGPFGEGLANNIADEFVKAMKGE